MAAKKYLELTSAGVLQEVQATVTSAGAGDDGKIVALDSTGKIDTSVLPSGVGPDTESMVTSDTLTAGDWVNIYDNTGTRNCRQADASNARQVDGFVLSGFSAAASATVYLRGVNNQLSGLTIGAIYYLTTSGAESTTAPTTGSHIVQRVGKAIAADSIDFKPSTPVIRA